MRNSAGFSPISLPQFTWPSIDKRRDPVRHDDVVDDAVGENTPEVVETEAAPPAEAPPVSTPESTGEETN